MLSFSITSTQTVSGVLLDFHGHVYHMGVKAVLRLAGSTSHDQHHGYLCMITWCLYQFTCVFSLIVTPTLSYFLFVNLWLASSSHVTSSAQQWLAGYCCLVKLLHMSVVESLVVSEKLGFARTPAPYLILGFNSDKIITIIVLCMMPMSSMVVQCLLVLVRVVIWWRTEKMKRILSVFVTVNLTFINTSIILYLLSIWNWNMLMCYIYSAGTADQLAG